MGVMGKSNGVERMIHDLLFVDEASFCMVTGGLKRLEIVEGIEGNSWGSRMQCPC